MIKADKKGLGFILLAVACYSLSPIIARFGYAGGLNVVTFLALRYTFSAILLTLSCLANRTALLPPRADRGRLFGIALVGGAGYCALYYSSLRIIPVTTAALLLYTYPAMVLLFARFWLGEGLDTRKIIALILALGGCAAVAGVGSLTLNPLGASLVLGAAACYAFYVVAIQKYTAHLNARVITLTVALYTAPLYWLYGLLTGTLLLRLPLQGWLAAGGAALVPSVFGNVAFFTGLKRVGAFRSSLLRSIEPAFSVVLAALLFGEKVTLVQAAGGILIIVAVVLSVGARQDAVRTRGSQKSA